VYSLNVLVVSYLHIITYDCVCVLYVNVYLFTVIQYNKWILLKWIIRLNGYRLSVVIALFYNKYGQRTVKRVCVVPFQHSLKYRTWITRHSEIDIICQLDTLPHNQVSVLSSSKVTQCKRSWKVVENVVEEESPGG